MIRGVWRKIEKTEKRQLWRGGGNLIAQFKYIFNSLKKCCREGQHLFSLIPEYKSQINVFKLQKKQILSESWGKNILIIRVIWTWNQLPTEILVSPSLTVFKQNLDRHFSGLLLFGFCTEQVKLSALSSPSGSKILKYLNIWLIYPFIQKQTVCQKDVMDSMVLGKGPSS